jgi:siroheme synthase-like protein
VTQPREVFPAFLLLRGRRVLVVGGGPVAASKVLALRRAGARVTVVAPTVVAGIAAAGVRIRRRRFTPRDLSGAWFVVAAATPDVNQRVARAAERRRVFVNAVDDAASASAYLGGVLERGGVTIAISTGGTAPALAGLVREGLEALIPPEIGTWTEEASALRPGWRTGGVPLTARRPLLLQALNRLYQEGRARPWA